MNKTKKYIQEIRKQGYTIVRNVLSDKNINSINKDIKRVLIESCYNICDKKEILGYKKKNIDFLYNYLKEKSPQLKAHCYDVLSKLAIVNKYINNNKLYEIAKKYLKETLVINSAQLRVDDPSDDRMLPWHQELEQMSLITLNVWLPLTNITEKSGGLSVIPESHKKGLQKHIIEKEINSYYRLPKKLLEKETQMPLFMNAGDAIVFHSFLFHKSTSNFSKRNRWTIVFRYNQLSTMPYLKSPKAKMFMKRNPKENEPGHNFIKNFKMNIK